MKSGIYAIRNTSTGLMYIGQSKDIKYRIRKHKEMLKGGRHPKSEIQESYDTFGKGSFTYLTLFECSPEELDFHEHRLTECYRERTSYVVCNISIGRKHSDSTKEKLRQANLGDSNPKYWLGKKRSQETKDKISKCLKGKLTGAKHPMYGKPGYWKGKTKPLSVNRKVSESLKGHSVSDETRLKMSMAKKGKSPSNKIVATEEMLADIKAGMTYTTFTSKYQCSNSVIKRIKKELKAKG